MRCCGGGQLVEGRAAVCGGGGKVVEVAIELGHVILGGMYCGGMGGHLRGDSVVSHRKVGGAKLVTTLGGSP